MTTNDPPSPRTKAQRFWLLGLLLLGLLAAAAFIKRDSFLPWFATTNPAKAKDKSDKTDKATGHPGKGAIAVTTAAAQVEDVPVYLEALGTVSSLNTVTVRTRVDGELLRIAFKEGQLVNKGELLAEIDPKPLQILLQQAQGQLTRDQALLKNAQTDLARYKTLLAQDSIAAQQVATQAALVKQYEGTVAVDQAQLDNAQLQLSYSKITAPISGRIGLKLVDQGNIVHVNDPAGLAVITQISPIAVLFNLPEDSLSKIMPHQHAKHDLAVLAYDRSGKNKLAHGKLLAIDNQIDLATGTIKLKSQFANSNGTLFANQFVNVKLLLETLTTAVTIPNTAVQHGTKGAFVYRLQADQSVHVTPVELGAIAGDRVVVLEGLAADEQVVVDGTDKLREGQKVKLPKQAGQLPKQAPHAP